MPTYYVFKTSQTWEVPAGLGAVDAIIVAGGGASSNYITGGQVGQAGGAGAGGVLQVTAIPLTPGASMNVVVGEGGTNSETTGADHSLNYGNNSSFAGNTAIGGGAGQHQTGTNVNDDLYPAGGGGSGGSGGGACGGGFGGDTGVRNAGSGTSGQGFPGGSVDFITDDITGPDNKKPGAGGGGALGPGESIIEEAQAGISGGAGIILADIDWWDQDIAHLLNPGVPDEVDIDLEGYIAPPEWQSGGGYTPGDVVWNTFSNRLYVLRNGDGSTEPTGTGNAEWAWLVYAVGGGAGGTNLGRAVHNPPGVGGGGEGARAEIPGTTYIGAQPNTGGGGAAARSGADGIIILRAADVIECTDVGIDQIVYAHARRAGIPASRIDVSALEPDSDFPSVIGMGIGRPATARNIVEILQRYAFFDLADIGGQMIASRRDRDPDGTIGGDDLRAHVYGETPPTLARREREEDYELPRSVRVNYSQAYADYEPGIEGYDRRVTDAEGVVDIDLTAIAMDPDQAAIIAEVATLEQIVHRESTDITLVATDANKALKPGDIKTLDVKGREDTVRITELGYAYPGIIKIKAGRHDPSIYYTDAVGAGRKLFGSVIFNHGTTTFELLDAPLVREFDDAPGYFGALGGIPTIQGLVEGWPGGNLQREEAAGWEDVAQVLRPGSVFGTASVALPDATHTIVTDDELWVALAPANALETVTLQEMLLGANLAALECTGGWELIRFTTAVYDESTAEWRITGIVRGVNGTEWAAGLHSIGDRFILLDGVAQVLTDIDLELNQSWQHNAATLGQDPVASAEVAFTWSGVDRIPYAPCHLTAERDSNDDLLLGWTRRDRVGKELQSGQTLPLSEDSEAYEVDIYNGAGDTVLRTLSVTDPDATYTAAQQTTDFGSHPTELDFAVYQIGALGRGYVARITIEGL